MSGRTTGARAGAGAGAEELRDDHNDYMAHFKRVTALNDNFVTPILELIDSGVAIPPEYFTRVDSTGTNALIQAIESVGLNDTVNKVVDAINRVPFNSDGDKDEFLEKVLTQEYSGKYSSDDFYSVLYAGGWREHNGRRPL